MSSNIIITDNYSWTNEHNNLSKQVLHRYQISNDPATGWKEGLAGIQSMIGEARQRKERLRSYGGKWSLSDVAICNDSIHDSKPLTFFGTVGVKSILGPALYLNDPKPLDQRLFYFQSGSQINQINNVLEARGLSLPTTGASNGQTIAGAVSTGTHGSAMKVGSMQDYVRALHIVTSEDKHYIVQPSTDPIVSDAFIKIFGAEPLNDDRVFRSALVSFGSFGVIHGMILETVSLFMLETYCLRMDYNKATSVYFPLTNFKHASTNNLSQFLKQFGLPTDSDPHHVGLVVNPHSTSDNTFLQVMYKREYDKNKLSPEPGGSDTRVGNDVLSVIGSLADSVGSAVPVLVNAFFGKVAAVQSGFTQTPRNIFGDSTMQRPKHGGASTELGVSVERAVEAVQLIINKAKQAEFMGVIGIRFVKNSAATLAFTRFSPLTCTIELPGLNSESTQNFYQNVFTGMDIAQIPFTFHWGQEGDYSPKRLSMMYGNAVNEWVNDRKRLLPDPMQRYMFSNDFLKRCGLSEAPPLTGGDVIA